MDGDRGGKGQNGELGKKEDKGKDGDKENVLETIPV